MSKTLQWILGVLAVLVIVGLVAGAFFMWRNHTAWWGARTFNYAVPADPDAQQGPTAPYRYDRYPRYHMMEQWGGGMPMHGYGVPYGMSPYSGGFFLVAGFLRLLLPLGVLALVAYVFYQMGKRAGSTMVVHNPAPPRDSKPLPPRKIAGR